MTGALDLAARNDLHASLPCGDPDRLRRPRTSRPFACWTGCHLATSAVKGRCALMSARSAFGRPLTAPAARRPGETRSPGAGEDLSPTSSQEVAPVGSKQQEGTVYLIHFQRPYKHARHYCGWVHSPTFLEPRLGAHRDGAGARLMAVIAAAGIGWELVRTWPANRAFERRLKRQGGLSRHCPVCRATGTYHR